jgi:ElaB/YqjD/DUF883 family membrane-anchored ribosome-binding protein
MPYADRAVARAEPIISSTKEHIHAVSSKTKDSVVATTQPFVQLVQPYVDATVEHAAKARSMTNDAIGATKDRIHDSSEAIAAAKAHAYQKKDEYVAYGTSTARSYFEKLTLYVQPYVTMSKERLTRIRANPQEMFAAGKVYVADKKDALVMLSQEGAQNAVASAKAKTQPLIEKAQPYVEKAEPLVRATVDRANAVVEKAASSYGTAAIKTSNAKASARSFVDAQRARFNDAKRRLMDALIPQGQQQQEEKEQSSQRDEKAPTRGSRILRVASLSFAAMTNLSLLAFAKVAESERRAHLGAQEARRRGERAVPADHKLPHASGQGKSIRSRQRCSQIRRDLCPGWKAVTRCEHIR